MKIGQKVKHKNTGQILTVKRIFGGRIASCYLPEKDVKNVFNNVILDTVICSVDLLEEE